MQLTIITIYIVIKHIPTLLFLFPDYLKQKSNGYLSNKHKFSELEDPSLKSKTIKYMGKNSALCRLNCSYRIQSPEDSGPSGSPSPARSLQIPCYGDASKHRFEHNKNDS